MDGLTPADWDSLVKRFVTNDDLFQEFFRNYVKRVQTSACTGRCKTSLLCAMVSSRSGDRSKCNFSNSQDSFL